MLERGFTISSAGRHSLGSEISVQGCPLVRPPVEVVAQGSQAVLNYFRELDAQGVAHLYEAKILIVGEGGAGKTSLLRRLYQPAAPLPGEDESTRGIDILATTFNLVDGRSCRLNVWDFGGQQIYHATHQFFLTKNAIYVLVDDTRKNDTSVYDPAFKYWLEVIEALSDRSPVLIFQNEKSGRSKTIDEAGIKGAFPTCRRYTRATSPAPVAAGGLKRAHRVLRPAVPHVGEALPAQWLEIRRTLEYRSQDVPFISQADYFDIYREHLPFDSDKALGLSRYLHQLGVLLHFQDDRRLRQLVILRNAWATEAVFSVLDDEGIKARSGRFSEADCDRVWSDAEHADRQLELISLMEKFELCYQLADSRPAQWLAPQLQPPSAPEELDRRPQPDDLILQVPLRVHAGGPGQPAHGPQPSFRAPPGAGLEIRCAVRARADACARGDGRQRPRDSPERARTGAEVPAERDRRRSRRRQWPLRGPQGREMGACCCTECATSSDPKLFAESDLMNRREKNKPDVECPASFERVSVLRLLDGLDLKRLPPWAAGDHERSGQSDGSATPAERTIRIFLASSSELREDRDAFDFCMSASRPTR